MAATIEVYTFEDAEGLESTFSTLDIGEAREFARDNRMRLIANVYELSDSILIEDHTGADDDAEPGDDPDDDESDGPDDGPDEEDLITPDGFRFYQHGGTGRLAFEVGPDEDRDDAIKAWMDREGFYPSAWSISDHGNAHRIDL